MRMYEILMRNANDGHTKDANTEPGWKKAMREGRAAGMPSIGSWLLGVVPEPPAPVKSLKEMVLDGVFGAQKPQKPGQITGPERPASGPFSTREEYVAWVTKARQPTTPRPPKPGSVAALVVEKMRAALARGVK